MRASDLKPGQFVLIEYRHVTAQNPATHLTVLKPVGGPDTPPEAETPKPR